MSGNPRPISMFKEEGYAMSLDILPFESKLTIPRRVWRRCPYPAVTRLVYLIPESLFYVHVSILAEF